MSIKYLLSISYSVKCIEFWKKLVYPWATYYTFSYQVLFEGLNEMSDRSLEFFKAAIERQYPLLESNGEKNIDPLIVAGIKRASVFCNALLKIVIMNVLKFFILSTLSWA